MTVYDAWSNRILRSSTDRKKAARLGFIAGLKEARRMLCEIKDTEERQRARDRLDKAIEQCGGTRWTNVKLP
jgi:hypothetical protein